MGYVGIALNAGSLIAPFLGGIVFAKCGYNAVFGLIIGIVGLDILLRLMMKEEPAATLEPGLSSKDMEAGIVVTVTVTEDDSSSTTDLIQPNTQRSSTIPRLYRLPRILRLFLSKRMAVTLWGTMVLAAIFSGFQTVLPLMVNSTFGWNATGGGLIFLPLSFPAVFGPIVGKFTDRCGGRWFAVAGFLLLSVSLILLRLVGHDSISQKALLCLLLTLIGCCMALILEPVFAEITHGATQLDQEDKDAGLDVRGSYSQAYALFNMAWASGNAIGPLWSGFVMDAAGWNTMSLSLGVLAGASSLPVALWCGGWLLKRQ